MEDEVRGFFAPVHRALTEHILLGGAPRAVAIANGTLGRPLVPVAPTKSEWLVFSRCERRSSMPTGSTRMSAMFCTSRTSESP